MNLNIYPGIQTIKLTNLATEEDTKWLLLLIIKQWQYQYCGTCLLISFVICRHPAKYSGREFYVSSSYLQSGREENDDVIISLISYF